MPDEAYWETLLDPDRILDRLGVDASLGDVAELGCGYGTFTLPAARRISGILRTCDIDAAMVARTKERAQLAGLGNVVCAVRDVVADGFDCGADSQDACLLFNILHGEHPVQLLGEAARIVRPGGWVLAIHWRHDPSTPRGPSMAIRPLPEQLVDWAQGTGMLDREGALLDLPPWHYGLRFRRRAVG